jgi:HAD superfamily hydrolase (TIGR01450 family)
MEALRKSKAFICDMDGVIFHGRTLLQGAAEFVNWLQEKRKQFLFLTNNSSRPPKQLREKLAGLGLHVTEDHFMTSAIATATFLSGQCPNGRAYVIGDTGLIEALDEVGFSLDDARPTDRRIRRGEAVLFDRGARRKLYVSDLTRVVFLDRIRGDLQRRYRLVRAAQRRALSRVRAGCRAGKLDAAARSYLKAWCS